jgi:hypothetical protein
MSKAKAVSGKGGDNALTDDELGKVAGGTVKFDAVDGEATHKDHKGEIEVLSTSVSTPTTPRRR